jgi:hypothetical protein
MTTATTQRPALPAFKSPASGIIYGRASDPFQGWKHYEIQTLAEAIALMERSEGNVPAFVDPEAEAWLRAKADAVLIPGRFKAESRLMKYDRAGQPKGVNVLGGLFTIDGANSATAHRQLLSMAEKCRGGDERTNLAVLTARIHRAIKANIEDATPAEVA